MTTPTAKCPGCGDTEGQDAVKLSKSVEQFGVDRIYRFEYACDCCGCRALVPKWFSGEPIAQRVVELMGESK